MTEEEIRKICREELERLLEEKRQEEDCLSGFWTVEDCVRTEKNGVEVIDARGLS